MEIIRTKTHTIFDENNETVVGVSDAEQGTIFVDV
jgi:hypothetical protein